MGSVGEMNHLVKEGGGWLEIMVSVNGSGVAISGNFSLRL